MNKIQLLDEFKTPEMWDSYLLTNPQASIYHQLFFRDVIQKTYNHRPYYLIATDSEEKITGVLPLFFINSLLFGKDLVSLPFCDYGGILANNDSIAKDLLHNAFELSEKLKCHNIELRQTSEQAYLNSNFDESKSFYIGVKKSKVRMRLSLPDSTDALFNSFSAKLRSQIRKPQKEGCISKCGGVELLDDFYDVFVHNMRDLGSPVHTKTLMKRMLLSDPEHTRIFVIYHNNIPAACSMVSGFNGFLVNPWASFKRTFQKIAPNMLLYWEMLSYAVNNKYRSFDFGRSTPGEGTFKFKEQWGALPEQLFWYTCSKEKINESEEDSENKKERFIKIWQKTPIIVTKIVGPKLRRHIHL